MENHQIQRKTISSLDLMVNGKMFSERQEYVRVRDGSEPEANEERSVWKHERKIDDLYYNVSRTRINGEVQDENIETNIPDEKTQAEFNQQWKNLCEHSVHSSFGGFQF